MKNESFARSVSEVVGRHLQRVRKEHGMNQDVFAEKLGVSRTTASNMECGRQRITLDQLYLAAHILKVQVEDLLPAIQITNEGAVTAAADDPLSKKEAHSVALAIRELIPVPSNHDG